MTKENAIMKITELCGTGAAMGNAIDEVKNKADIVIGSNDEDWIAFFIEENLFIGGE